MTDDSEHPPRRRLWIGWVILGVLAIGLLFSGWFIVRDAHHSVAGRPTLPPMLGGGGSVAEKPTARMSSAPSAPSPTAPGETFDVAGVGGNRTIECGDHDVSVSGVDNTVVVTGHCNLVDVSGVGNTVVLDSADAIDVSGLNNKVTFHSGTPRLSNSGLNNTLNRH